MHHNACGENIIKSQISHVLDEDDKLRAKKFNHIARRNTLQHRPPHIASNIKLTSFGLLLRSLTIR
jgi:hypothetical protein